MPCHCPTFNCHVAKSKLARNLLGPIFWVVGAALDSNDHVQGSLSNEEGAIWNILQIGSTIQQLEPGGFRIEERIRSQLVEGARPIGNIIRTGPDSAELTG